MLRMLAYFSLFAFLAINTYFLVVASDDINKENVSNRLSSLEKSYDDCLYECFFALDELRPFAIIQSDKLIQMYNNSWTEPNKLAEVLSSNEKRLLLAKVAEFIDEKEEISQSLLMNKITNWCRVSKLFEVINTDYGYSQSEIVRVTSEMEATSYILPNVTRHVAQADISNEALSDIEENEIYYKTINHIAGLKINTQFELYSGLFKNLAKQSE